MHLGEGGAVESKVRSVLAGMIVLAVAVWFLFPHAFVRGAMAGVVLTIGLAVGFGFLSVRRMKRRMGGRLEPPPVPTESWDYELSAADLEGHPVDFIRFSGEVLVLNLWATWCAPCVTELPSLSRLQEATSELGVRLACVTREKREVVERFVEERAPDVPIYIVEGEIPECFSSRGIPATYVLDRNGLIAFRHMGAAAWDDPRVVTFIRGLAAIPAD
jgi:thiol-disulfide isomerase/thioredoxin